MSPQLTLSAYGEHVSCMGELTPQPATKLSKRILWRLGKERIQIAIKNHPEACEENFAGNFQAVYTRD